MPGPYQVVRKEFFGDPGSLAATNMSRVEAEEYSKRMAQAERKSYEIILRGEVVPQPHN